MSSTFLTPATFLLTILSLFVYYVPDTLLNTLQKLIQLISKQPF